MKYVKILSLLLCLSLLAGTAAGCAPSRQGDRLQVTATVFPLYDWARNIAGTAAEVTLLADGTAIRTITLSEADGWTRTIDGLPLYDQGKAIEYTWEEEETANYRKTNHSVHGQVTTLTNTHAPALTSLSVTKVWDDAGNQDGKRPTADVFKDKLRLHANAGGTNTDVTDDYKKNLKCNKNIKSNMASAPDKLVGSFTTSCKESTCSADNKSHSHPGIDTGNKFSCFYSKFFFFC
jgi:hypothetical protein